ncbi:hypothetical protein MCHI_001897, partial [Candidatus Magnetoovum chiemensis]
MNQDAQVRDFLIEELRKTKSSNSKIIIGGILLITLILLYFSWLYGSIKTLTTPEDLSV